MDKKPKASPKASREPAELVQTERLIESDNYEVWISHEPDGEKVYHIELDFVTLHFFREEWREFTALIQSAVEEDSSSPSKK